MKLLFLVLFSFLCLFFFFFFNVDTTPGCRVYAALVIHSFNLKMATLAHSI